MIMKKLKTGTLSLLFNVEGVDYSIMLSGTNDNNGEDSENKTSLRYKIKLSTGNRNILLEKVVDGENPPEYKMEGEGMDKKEMVEFGNNWMTMVSGSLETFEMLQEIVDAYRNDGTLPRVCLTCHGMDKLVGSFINMLNFF